MKSLDRITLVNQIGRELQKRMSYADIDVYLKGHGVDITKLTHGVNSKWVHTKERLADVPEETILRIADELGIPHGYVVTATNETVEATFWLPHHFRLFLSHISSFKKKATALQAALRRLGISGFVAHVDIEPTREWQKEIEAGLASMEALAAILMPGFKDSNWTDQEVGVAVGQGVLVIPIIRGLNPYGFIGKYQGFNADGKTVAEVAQEVFGILTTSPRTRTRMLTCLVDTTLQAAGESDAIGKLQHLGDVHDLPISYLERLREGATASSVFSEGPALDLLNELLVSRGLEKVALKLDDSIPF